jgi:zinc protease
LTDQNDPTILFPENYFAGVKSKILANGMRIYVFENNTTPTVSVQAWVKTGSIHEDKFLGAGLSHFLEHMLFQGCEGFPGNSMAENVSRLGGSSNAYTSFGRTVYYIDLPSRHTDEAIDMLAAMVSTPEFPEDKFVSEKQVIMHESAMIYDEPMRVLSEKLWSHSFVQHPVRHPIIGYPDKISEVSRDMMMEYYQQRYSPDRSFFVVTGQVDADEVIAKIEQQLGEWKHGCMVDPVLPVEPRQVYPRKFTYHFNDPLARLAIGYKLPEASHHDIPALNILTSLLGRTDSSRLVQRFMVEEELAIGINASNYTSTFCGVSGIYALATVDKLDKLEAGIREEIDKIISDGVTDAELEREVIQNSTTYLRNLRSNSGLASLIGGSIIDYETPEYADHYIKEITAVTNDDIQRVAKRYFKEKYSTAIRLLPEKTPAETEKTSTTTSKNDESVTRKCLNGGERLIYFHENKLPLVDISICLPGGSFFENAEQSGISQLVSSMLTTGTTRWNESEFLRQLDDNGIVLDVSSHLNSLMVKLNCRRDKVNKAFSLMESMLREPAFAEKAFLREQQNMLEMLNSRKLNPQAAAIDKTISELYGSHPYSRPSTGLSDTVEKLSLDAVRNFYFTHCLRRDKAVFGVCGDIDATEAEQLTTQLAANLPWAQTSEFSVAPPVFPTTDSSCLVHVPREQAVVIYAFPGCDNLGDENLALSLLFAAENHQASALFKTIREDAGLAYYTGMTGSFGLHPGYLAFYAGTAPENAKQVIELLKAEQQRLLKTGLTEEEFAAARENKFFSTAKTAQNPGGMLTKSCLEEYYGNSYKLPWQLADKYAALQLDEVNQVITRFLKQPSVTVTALPISNQ